jgi:sulfur-carrier protein
VKILVKAFATFREVMDSQIDMDLKEGATILTLLDELMMRYKGLDEMMFDDNGTLRNFINILRNGRNVQFLAGLDTPLSDGDVIALFPPLAGG